MWNLISFRSSFTNYSSFDEFIDYNFGSWRLVLLLIKLTHNQLRLRLGLLILSKEIHFGASQENMGYVCMYTFFNCESAISVQSFNCLGNNVLFGHFFDWY